MARMLKKLKEKLLKPLIALYNLTFQENKVPEDRKQANVTLVNKKEAIRVA